MRGIRDRLAGFLLVVVLTAGADAWVRGTSFLYPDGSTAVMRGVVRAADRDVSPWDSRPDRPVGESMQHLTVETPLGPLQAENPVTGSPIHDRLPRAADRVLLRVRQGEEARPAVLRELERDRWLIRVAGSVAAGVVLLFGAQGLRAVLALGAGLAAFMALPGLIVRLRWPPFPVALGGVLFAIGTTYMLLCGFTRKSLGAATGALIGAGLSGMLAVVVVAWCGLSGLHDEDLMAMQGFTVARALDFRSLLVAGMLLGTVGVVMDVAIGTASAVSELRNAAPHLGGAELRARGMVVGRKVMGAMILTLALAYTGANFGLFLLPHAEPGNTLAGIFANERVAAEVIRLLIGMTAIVWTIPATAWITAWLETRRTA